MEHREQWRHPDTQELAEIDVRPGVVRLRRGSVLTEHRHSPDREQAGREQVVQQRAAMQQFEEHWEVADGPVPTPLAEFSSSTRNIADVNIAPPQDGQLLFTVTETLRTEGFVRNTARRPDGSLWLPEELESWREELEASERPVVRLTRDLDRVACRWDSKLGGVPYRPLGTPWPVAKTGDYPLSFLAQLNLAELNPGGAFLPGFPAVGLLQFFILDDMFYGAEDEPWMALNGAQTFYRVLYWPSIMKDEQLLETGKVAPPDAAPWEGSPYVGEELPFDPAREIVLVGVPDREAISGSDRGVARLAGTNPYEITLESGEVTLSEAMYALSPGGHKLGGYPDFTQSDPRGVDDDDLVLLFQLDSDRMMDMMWGDVGTASFFIHRSDLMELDFSRVAYQWDCG